MKRRKVFILSFILIFSVVYAHLLKVDKDARAQKNIIKFQSEYKEFVEKKYIFNNKLLNDVADATFNKKDLPSFYDEMKVSTFQNIEKQFLNELYDFNFYKGENTISYSKENKESHDQLIKSGEAILKEKNNEEKIRIIKELKTVNKDLNNISKLELENDKKAIDEFNMAVNNLETRSKTDKGCFRNQTNSKWKIDLEASSKLCNALGFSNCQRYDNENGEQQFNGFSLNDPASFLKDTNYVEYVSFDSDDFRLEYKEKFEKLSSKYNIFSEVYTHNVNGKDIYKYNIVAIDKSYIIGCSKPK